jgi:hypothetical protein
MFSLPTPNTASGAGQDLKSGARRGRSGRPAERPAAQEIANILARMPNADRRRVLAALRVFAEAAGQVPEQDWPRGWDL